MNELMGYETINSSVREQALRQRSGDAAPELFLAHCSTSAVRYAWRMRISDEGLKEFIAICKDDYGVDLTEGEAGVLAVQALLLYEFIYRPLPSELRATQPSTDSPAPDQEAQ